MSTSRTQHGARQGGLSMIELVVFIVIIGVAVAGVLATLTYTTKRSADPLQRKQAMLIAEALLDEISLGHMTFCHPDDPAAETATSAAGCATPETVGPSGAARPYFNINDYVLAFNTPTSITPGDSTGKVTDVLGNLKYGGRYQAFVTVRANATLGPAGATALNGSASGAANPADTDLLHISVQVKYGSGEQIVLDRYRTRYAPNSTP
jgi:MSHA pilin protein MshD